MRYSDLYNHYENMLNDPFPRLVSDIKDDIRRDLYEKYICGGVSKKEFQTLYDKFVL